MTTEQTIQKIQLIFRSLDTVAASTAIPPPGTLADILNNSVGIANAAGNTQFTISQAEASKFATAAVEMWHRAVHSFLVSASLTRASPLWSSVCGYYSSHYTVRAFAHLFGNFLLYRRNKCRVVLEINAGSYLCQIIPKGGDREHKFYWKKVKENDFFSTNDFYTINDETSSVSDASHRNKANYFDHIGRFPQFQILDYEFLNQRVNVISTMRITSPPIPNSDIFPDLDNVQLSAYYRLVNFRFFLDDIVLTNRFWSVQRNPAWCPDFLKFQLNNEEFITVYKEFLP